MEFSADNAGGGERACVGTNYLDVCRLSTGTAWDEAIGFHDGLNDVLEGRAELFQIEYPCHSPAELRWFSARVKPLVRRNGARNSEKSGAVVSHMNITDKKIAHSYAWPASLANLSDEKLRLEGTMLRD